ncbi:SMC-Scp complex subunit ScpB [Candidatus Uhrbacteria bacterium]|nr:SMC-Scp complex subunit ScpB [Candidatus Uhrbacteria bacterium]
MEELQGKIEAVLFVSTKPTSIRALAKVVGASDADARSAVAALAESRNASASGIHVLVNGDDVQLVTNSAYADVVAAMTAVELDQELTRPSLETLTIIAYRGPVTKPEIEAIRGVNCSLIIRNLLMRGLIDERDDAVKMLPTYRLSADALRYFGVRSVEELPDYGTLHANAKIDQLLANLSAVAPEAAV